MIVDEGKIQWKAVLCALAAVFSSMNLRGASEVYSFQVIAGQPGRGGDPAATNATLAKLGAPTGVAVDSSGNVYAVELHGAIRKISPGGTIVTLAGKLNETGFVDGPGESARFSQPQGVASARDGTLYVTDFRNRAVRRITPDGIVSTLAGGTFGFNDGTGPEAQFQGPTGVAVEKNGNILVSDIFGNNIRRITPAGVVTTLAGAKAVGPMGGSNVDGPGALARFYSPHSIALDAAGNIYVTDSSNFTIRKVTPDGYVTTIAGTPGKEGFRDGKGAEARFNSSFAIAVDSMTNIFVMDQGQRAVLRRIDTNGEVITLESYSVHSSAPTTFGKPESMTIDSAGNIYVADVVDWVIWKGAPSVKLAAPKLEGSAFTIAFSPSRSAGVLEYSDSLTAPYWQPVPTSAASSPEPLTAVDPNATVEQRFYRVRKGSE